MNPAGAIKAGDEDDDDDDFVEDPQHDSDESDTDEQFVVIGQELDTSQTSVLTSSTVQKSSPTNPSPASVLTLPPINPIISVLANDPQVVAAEFNRAKKKNGGGDLTTLIAELKRETINVLIGLATC